jgi:hypothetical protein
MTEHGARALTETSAFMNESYFAELKNDFRPGTTSTGKQAMRSAYAKKLSGHKCTNSLFLQSWVPSKLGKSNNSLVFTFQNATFQLYRLTVATQPDCDFVVGQKIQVEPFDPDMDLPNFNTIGVFLNPCMPSRRAETVNIPLTSIAGKCVVVERYIVTMPTKILFER